MGGTMASTLEKRFDTLVSDVHSIQKELILSKIQNIKRTKRHQDVWNALSQKISSSWDTVSAVDEIASQREKQW
jgi:hypothetical protein